MDMFKFFRKGKSEEVNKEEENQKEQKKKEFDDESDEVWIKRIEEIFDEAGL